LHEEVGLALPRTAENFSYHAVNDEGGICFRGAFATLRCCRRCKEKHGGKGRDATHQSHEPIHVAHLDV
jgi:hypothetical protein